MLDTAFTSNKGERPVNSYLAEGLADIIVTGSNSHLLAGELSTLLSGRFIEISMCRLSLGEFLLFRKASGGDVTSDAEGVFRAQGNTVMRIAALYGTYAVCSMLSATRTFAASA